VRLSSDLHLAAFRLAHLPGCKRTLRKQAAASLQVNVSRTAFAIVIAIVAATPAFCHNHVIPPMNNSTNATAEMYVSRAAEDLCGEKV
jgi:hypothetical protein